MQSEGSDCAPSASWDFHFHLSASAAAAAELRLLCLMCQTVIVALYKKALKQSWSSQSILHLLAFVSSPLAAATTKMPLKPESSAV